MDKPFPGLVRIVHEQTDSEDILSIYMPGGYLYGEAKSPIEDGMTPLESAVSALWSGYMEVVSQEDRFGGCYIAVSSSTDGAATKWDEEFNATVKEAADEA